MTILRVATITKTECEVACLAAFSPTAVVSRRRKIAYGDKTRSFSTSLRSFKVLKPNLKSQGCLLKKKENIQEFATIFDYEDTYDLRKPRSNPRGSHQYMTEAISIINAMRNETALKVSYLLPNYINVDERAPFRIPLNIP